MTKEPFGVSPFPAVHVSELERQELIDLVDSYVEDYTRKYEDFVQDKRQVDKRRWEHVKSKDNVHVYAERTRKELKRRGFEPENSLSATQRLKTGSKDKDLPLILSVGTLVGELDDLMYGVVNPTLEQMRIKTSYVGDLESAALLCSVLGPSKEDPFRSIVIKWMTVDVPLHSTHLVKSRDFVYIEATGTVFLPNGDRAGYHLLHSIDFPQTTPLPHKVRANLSLFACYTQLDRNLVDNFACATVDPGVNMMRSLLLSVAAGAMLTTTNFVYCGQMKKLAWLLQHHHSAYDTDREAGRTRRQCVVCSRKTTRVFGSIGKSTCKICYGCVCYSCKIRQCISFIVVGGRLIQRKVVVCAKCMGESTQWNAQEAARDQIADLEACKSDESSTSYEACTVSCEMSFLESSASILDQ
ncbi:hypothetical protein P3T76_007509 [Phytophthora citrophthora]|uniref:FYVE-type domain-containing protein n=1 Tax=Phytophthora citrophthora TaxID=4793 RepID=A0AAD9GME1_9STRA|nr:hypothetical protein P3T76_007509 [Phytophthora citrophthora]